MVYSTGLAGDAVFVADTSTALSTRVGQGWSRRAVQTIAADDDVVASGGQSLRHPRSPTPEQRGQVCLQVVAAQPGDLVPSTGSGHRFVHPRVAQDIAQPAGMAVDVFEEPVYALRACLGFRIQVGHGKM